MAILDADKEGFLRNHRSLTQTAGRAARNVNGKVIMYADKITDSMKRTIEETDRRRAKQMAYNKEHGITPTPIVKNTKNELIEIYEASPSKSGRLKKQPAPSGNTSAASGPRPVTAKPRPYIEEEHVAGLVADPVVEYMTPEEIAALTERVTADMVAAVRRTEFIVAAQLRDELIKLQDIYDGIKGKPAAVAADIKG